MNRSSKFTLITLTILCISIALYEIFFWFGTPPTVEPPADESSSVITVDGQAIAYRTQGAGDAVMLLHSGAWSSIEYRFIAEALDDTYTVYLVDLPGFGYSDKPQVTYSLSYLEEQMMAFVDQFPEERFHLVGSSISGTLSILLASEYPERVRSVTTISPVGFGSEINQSSIFTQVPVLAEILFNPNKLIFNFVLDNGVLNSARLSEEFREELYAQSKLPKAQRAKLSILRSTLSIQGVQPELMSTLDTAAVTVRQPILLLWGSEDTYTPIEQLDHATSMMPAANIYELVDTGHFAHIESPDLVLEYLLPFLDNPTRKEVVIEENYEE